MLRHLQEKDIDAILEWMTDPEINCFFRFDSSKITRETVREFVNQANLENSHTKHFAIVDESDEYMGTISLKNIDLVNQNAEYAISTRKRAHGSGIAASATAEILKYAFTNLELHRVYLNVLAKNCRAIKFYEKMGFVYEGRSREHLNLHGKYEDLIWFGINYGDYVKKLL